MSKLEKFYKKLAYDIEWNYADPEVNTDHPFCPICGNTMNFHNTDTLGIEFAQGDAYWKCDCGFCFDEKIVRNYNSENG